LHQRFDNKTVERREYPSNEDEQEYRETKDEDATQVGDVNAYPEFRFEKIEDNHGIDETGEESAPDRTDKRTGKEKQQSQRKDDGHDECGDVHPEIAVGFLLVDEQVRVGLEKTVAYSCKD